jgi:hypothetical protein
MLETKPAYKAPCNTHKLVCKIAFWELNFLRTRECMDLAEEHGCWKVKFIDAWSRGLWVLLHRGYSMERGRCQCFKRLNKGHCGGAPDPSHVAILIKSELAEEFTDFVFRFDLR